MNKNNKIIMGIIFILLCAFLVSADNGVFDNVNYNNNHLYNISYLNSSNINVDDNFTINNNKWIRAIDNAGTGFINMFKVTTADTIEVGANMSIGNIQINEDNGLIKLVDMSVSATPVVGTDQGYNFSLDDYTFMSIFADADSAGGISNKSVNFGVNINGSGYNFTGDYFIGSLTGTASTATTWDGETSQADLNVNSSNYWDALNTPADINCADITDDNTYVTIVGDVMTGQLNMSANIEMATGYNVTFVSGGWISSNTTCLLLRSPDGTGIVEVCNT